MEGDEAGMPPSHPITTITKPKSTAARLPCFIHNWAKVCSNNFILRIVAKGYKIQFISRPIQNNFSQRDMSASSLKICSNKVKEFCHQGAVIPVSLKSCKYISYIFPVPKKAMGEFRIIFDLSELNKFIRKVHFRMDNILSIMTLIYPGDWLVSIDLSDAYHSVAIHPSSMPYLAFALKNIFYLFTCLPQGLTSSPRIFTMLMRVILKFLRSFSIKIAAWLDDFIVAASSASLVSSHASFSIRSFQELGFIPNIDKSHLKPTQRLLHLGLVWDTVSYTVSVPFDKLENVQKKCLFALSSKVSIQFLSSILGSIEFFRWGFPFAAVHYRSLQRCVTSHLSKGFSYETRIYPSQAACLDLDWWASCGTSLPARSLYSFSPDINLWSDSSETGWGGWSSQGDSTYGFWSLYESFLHINILELKAVFFLLKSFFRQTYNCSILIHTDNTTVIAYINNQGGSCSARLCHLALDIWNFCIQRNIMIQAIHIPGVENIEADKLSRMPFNDHSYYLSQNTFDNIQDKLSFPLYIDCFASRLNYKLPNFISFLSDPLSSMVNAFSFKWSENVYLFPPLPLINKVISKFITDSVKRGLFITPYWPSRPWFSSLLNLLIGQPILLPLGSIQDHHSHLPKRCRFLAWPIGCSPMQQQAYLGRLPSLSSVALKGAPFVHTRNIGEGSVCGVVRDKLITVTLP